MEKATSLSIDENYNIISNSGDLIYSAKNLPEAEGFVEWYFREGASNVPQNCCPEGE